MCVIVRKNVSRLTSVELVIAPLLCPRENKGIRANVDGLKGMSGVLVSVRAA